MKFPRFLLAALLLGPAAITPVDALDFKSVGATPAILYDAPSEKGRRVFIAPRGMPVEVVLTYGDWSKVRDVAGTLSWVMSSALVTSRHVVVSVANAKIHAAADDNSATIFSADRNVLLELAGPTVISGWLKVKHQDGQTGFVKADEVWGD
ncbi:MAG: SH3 domain-containing protein [Herbaspirillum sp.]